MFSDITNWWIFISIASVFNIILWGYSAVIFTRRKKDIDPKIFVWRKLMLWCSGIYVFGCAFRSFFPRIDLERICLVDSYLSNMFIGRSVATLAELCFIIQCAILLREGGKGLNDRLSVIVSFSLVPMIFIAEGFSWYGMLTTHYLGSVVEESLWAIAGVLLLVSFISLWPRVAENQRNYLAAMIIFSVGFIIFMVTIDVPMYWTRWQADMVAGVQYLSIGAGIMDSLNSCDVNFDIESWREEMPWMTLYFTAAVWVSISLTHAPNYTIIKKPESL